MPSALLHPFGDPAVAEEDLINLVRAEGSTLWDDNGKAYIDGLGSLWLCQVGHGRQDMVDAITEQMGSLVTYNIFPPFTNDVAARAADAVARVSPMPDGRVFFGSSGSEAGTKREIVSPSPSDWGPGLVGLGGALTSATSTVKPTVSESVGVPSSVTRSVTA